MKIGIVGLGYVGIQLAIVFARQHETIGFDLDEEKLAAHAVDVAGRFGWGRRRGAGMYLVGPEQT